MAIKLSDHFSYGRLLRFTLPSIVMMIFTSIYSVVDGFFVSNFVGKTPFAAVNFIMPFLMILGAFGFMAGTGGSALIARALGQKDPARANSLFSLFVYLSIGLGLLLTVVGFVALRPVAAALGASGQLLQDCVTYGRVVLFALPAFLLQMEFQSFFIAAEKPHLGLAVTVAAGLTNIVLDAVFVGIFRGGLVGAAAATVISQTVGGLIPLFYFFGKNTSLLRLGKTRWDGRAVLKMCTNGSSELMSNVSMSLVGMLYNAQLIRYCGEDGVAAYGVLMYVNMIFLAAFIGYSIGTAPVVSYHYGAGNHAELKSLLVKSLWLLGICSVGMLILSEAMAFPLCQIFVGYDPALLELTHRGFLLYSFSFLFAGIAIFGSSFFTALSDGATSALIAGLRTLLFQTAAVLILPLLLGVDGIWLSMVVAEFLACAVTVLFLKRKRRIYQY